MDREAKIRQLINEGLSREQAEDLVDKSGIDFSKMEELLSQPPSTSQYSPYKTEDSYGQEVGGNPYSIYGDDTTGVVEYGVNFMNNMPTLPETGESSPNTMIIRDEMNPRFQNPDGAPPSVEIEPKSKKGWAYEPEEGEEDPNKKQGLGEIPLIYGGGTSSEYEAYSLGNFLGMDKGTKGRGLGIAGSAGALGLGLLRQGFSGFANQKQNERSKNWATDKMNERNYKNNPQYRDRNYTGGRFKMGGTITLKPKSKN